jgi:hypothetical protein
VIATANWKEEFKDRLGQPGFEPDRRVTAGEFLFRYHTPGQLVRYTALGYLRIYGKEVFDSHHYLLANLSDGWGRYVGLHSPSFVPLIFLAGTVGLLLQRGSRRRAWLVPAVCAVGVLPPIGFVAGIPGQPEMYQARYAYMVAPFAAATVAWALSVAGARLAVTLQGGTRLPPFWPPRRGWPDEGVPRSPGGNASPAAQRARQRQAPGSLGRW